MDPFSTATSALSIVDLSIKVVKFIRKTKRGTDTIDEDLEQLVVEIEKLKNASELIHQAFKDDIKQSSNVQKKDDDATTGIWRVASSALEDCKAALTKLDSVLDQIKGEEGSSTFDRLRRHFRKNSKDEEFVQLRQRLEKGHQTLQLSLTSLNIIETRELQAGNARSNAEQSAQMASLEAELKQLIRSLESTMPNVAPPAYEKDSIATAKSIRKLAWVNVHFMIPQPVSNMFMGREKSFVQLRQAMADFRQERGTKRVVVYGLNGSGKTQFCCKFAQDNRPSFWGVFFIDATDSGTVQSSYADIAQKAGIEPKKDNVKHWLSEQTRPWLLIVDNADDRSRRHNPLDFIPESESGLVVFTTNNHEMSTLGDLSVKFEGLEEERASELLLRSAKRPSPSAPKMKQTATRICRRFGFLPLAILHAGKAILKGTCTLDNCLDYVERSLTRVGKIIRSGEAKMAGSYTKEADYAHDDAVQTVYATYELIVPAAREEALQILRLLSFMESQRFHFQILLKAIVNPQRQSIADKRPATSVKPLSGSRRRPWDRTLRSFLRKAYGFMEQLGERAVLPNILRSLKDADPQDAEDQLRGILSELRALALIDHSEEDEDDTYCMHPAVNFWIRASMEYQEKAVWCQAACNVLTLAILLPPVGVQDGDALLRRQTLPHIRYVRKQEEELRAELQEKQTQRGRMWPSVEPVLGRSRMIRDAKFGLVYAESGMWHESRELMLGIDRFLVKAIGLDDPVAIRVRLFLSETYWWLGEPNESIRLQEELLAACRMSLGDEHVDTLNVWDRLGSSFWQQGLFFKAQEHSQRAVDGFQKAYPAGHVDRFRAMTNLGRILGKLANFERAVELHSEALDGLEQAQKASDSHYGDQILDVKENLAMARYDRQRYGNAQADDLREAARLEGEVFEAHRKKLGKEHPKSLWAICNLARIKASTGMLKEAERMMKDGLGVAVRTIGANHRGTLMGEAYLGQILTFAGKLDEAEVVLDAVVKKHEAQDGLHMHPDHLVAASFLLNCCRQQGKDQTADSIEVVVLTGIKEIFGEGSPWERFFIGNYTVETGAGASQGR